MPKLFRFIFTVLCLLHSISMMAKDAICPEPNKDPSENAEITSLNLPQPTADEYHQASIDSANLQLDWVDDPFADSPCGGYYQVPSNPNPQKHLDPDEADIRLSADVAENGLDGFTAFSGEVELYQGKRRLRCSSMRYSAEKNYSEVKGNIQLREPGIMVMADQAIFDGINKVSHFTQTEYVLSEQQAHGKAGFISLDAGENGSLTLENASFTFCPPTSEIWSFEANKIELDPVEGWGKLHSAVFHVAKVPVIYIPYLDFPIDKRRKSGVLWPSFSSSDRGGIDITVPYYFNLAPQTDLTYVPRYNSDHGLLNGLESRYKHRYADWIVGGAYLYNDERVGDIPVNSNPDLDGERWLGYVKENGRFNSYWSTSLDYQSVSDINYFRDWGTTGLDVRKSLNIKRTATLNFTNANWQATSTLIDYQPLELDPLTNKTFIEPYRQLPSIYVNYRDKKQRFHLVPLFFGQYTYYDHDTLMVAQRAYVEPGLSYPLQWQAGEIIPTVKIKHTEFILSQSNDASTQASLATPTEYQGEHSINATSMNIDSSLFLEQPLTISAQNFTQTLRPRLYYYFSERVKQRNLPSFDTDETAFSYHQLFRDNRFGSYDRIADANQISWALESDLISQSNGRKIIEVGIGQILYFQDREVTITPDDNKIDPNEVDQNLIQEIDRRYYRNSSDIALEPRWNINDNEHISSGLIWDPYLTQYQETAIGYHYSDRDNHIFNIAYRYKRTPYFTTPLGWQSSKNVDQTDISFFLPMLKNWFAYMRWNYDVNNEQSIEDMAGVKYEGCCFNVMFAYQRERKSFEKNVRIDDNDPTQFSESWSIQFELKGLGGVTNSVTSLLEETIQGYKQRE